MLLPLRLLVTLHISIKQKLGLICLFSLGIIVIIFAFVRLSNVTKATAESQIDPTTSANGPIILALWSTIEAAVAVIVANLPAFRSLLRKKGQTGYSNSKGDRGQYTIGSKGSTSQSGINRRGVELESLHSFEEEISGEERARAREFDEGGDKGIVMTRHVSVQFREVLDGDVSETSRIQLGLPRT